MSIFTIQPTTEVKDVIISAFETKPEFDKYAIGNIFMGQPGVGLLNEADNNVKSALEGFYKIALRQDCTSLSELVVKTSMYFDRINGLNTKQIIIELIEFIRDCGFQESVYVDFDMTNPSGSITYCYDKSPKAIPVKEDKDFYLTIVSAVENNGGSVEKNYSIEKLPEEFEDKETLEYIVSHIKEGFLSSSSIAKSLEEVKSDIYWYVKTEEEANKIISLGTNWLKASGFIDARGEVHGLGGEPSFIFYAK